MPTAFRRADLGLYEQRVADQYHDEYVRPQESGTKGGLRWWTVADSAGTGLMILADAPFSASALPYATADLDVSNFPPQQHSGTLVARDATFVNFDLLQPGPGLYRQLGRHCPKSSSGCPTAIIRSASC